MRIFICILSLAVASCKAGFDYHSYNNDQHNMANGDTGYNYNQLQAQPQVQEHVQEIQGQHNPHQSANMYQGFQPSAQAFQHFDYQAPQQLHNYQSAPNYGQNDGYQGNLQSRGFEEGHGDVTTFGPSGSGDSYLQAAHDSGYGNGEQGYGQQGHGQQGHGQQSFVLEDGNHDFGGHGGDSNVIVENGHGDNNQDFGGYNGHAQSYPINEHTDIESPVAVPVYKHVTYPIHKPIHINVPKPILIGVPQPYPVKVPVNKPVAVPVETEISIPVHKPVPYPVVKHVPYPVEKHVPIKVEKTVTVHVPQPYPIKIPIYKTIHHYKDHY